jgi:hypothetical protein
LGAIFVARAGLATIFVNLAIAVIVLAIAYLFCAREGVRVIVIAVSRVTEIEEAIAIVVPFAPATSKKGLVRAPPVFAFVNRALVIVIAFLLRGATRLAITVLWWDALWAQAGRVAIGVTIARAWRGFIHANLTLWAILIAMTGDGFLSSGALTPYTFLTCRTVRISSAHYLALQASQKLVCWLECASPILAIVSALCKVQTTIPVLPDARGYDILGRTNLPRTSCPLTLRLWWCKAFACC